MSVEIHDLRRTRNNVLSIVSFGGWLEAKMPDGEVRFCMRLRTGDVHRPTNETTPETKIPVADPKTGSVRWLDPDTKCRPLNVSIFVNEEGSSATPQASDI